MALLRYITLTLLCVIVSGAEFNRLHSAQDSLCNYRGYDVRLTYLSVLFFSELPIAGRMPNWVSPVNRWAFT